MDRSPIGPLDLVHTEEEELAILAAAVRSNAVDATTPQRVLEAGCGRSWKLGAAAGPVHITGVDIDETAVRLRVEEVGDLAEAIVGDLRTLDLPAASFDVVYCSFVIEHIDGAEAVLDRLLGWLRPGGLLLLRLPDGDAVWGFVTRHTPHRAHVAFRRHAIGMPGAGTAGHGPFPVRYDAVVSRGGIRAWAERRGATIAAELGTNHYLQRLRGGRGAVALGVRCVAAISAGRLAADHNNLTYVIRAPDAVPPAT